MISFFKKFTKFEKIILAVIFIIYCHNLFIDIMQVDAAQYAGISSQMAYTNSYLEIKEFQNDYLDKPPLLFWFSSVGIKIFGITNFGYKIASFLFLLFSLYAVYRFALLYYKENVAKNALIILASTQAFFLMTNDVRTDSFLTSCVIISVWLFSEFFENRKLINLIFGSVFIALAMMAKGPIGMIAVLLPIGINLMYKQKWKDVFAFRWILVLLIIAVLLIPMSYGLYMQFDMHPEKITNGVKGQSGLYFYYWLQSFGRITGENVWNNGHPWHFFLGSIFWDYFPWIIPLYFAVFFTIKNFISFKIKLPEITSLIGFVSVFAMLSLSKYKLPHYVFVTFPFASVITAVYLTNLEIKIIRRWKFFNYFLAIIILTVFLVYPIFFFKEFNFWVLLCIIFQIFVIYYVTKSTECNVPILLSLVLTLNIFLSFVLYPKLLTFQADSMAGKWAYNNIKQENVYIYNSYSNSFSFYDKKPFIKVIKKEELNNIKKPFWIYINNENLNEIKESNLKITIKKSFENYSITQLKLKFLLSDCRKNQLNYKFLIKIEK